MAYLYVFHYYCLTVLRIIFPGTLFPVKGQKTEATTIQLFAWDHTRNCVLHPVWGQYPPKWTIFFLFYSSKSWLWEACDISFCWVEQRDHPFHRDSLFVPWPLLCYQVHPGSPQNIVCFQFGFSLFIELDFFLIINVIHKHIYYSSAEAPNTRGRGRRVALPSPGREKVC